MLCQSVNYILCETLVTAYSIAVDAIGEHCPCLSCKVRLRSIGQTKRITAHCALLYKGHLGWNCNLIILFSKVDTSQFELVELWRTRTCRWIPIVWPLFVSGCWLVGVKCPVVCRCGGWICCGIGFRTLWGLFLYGLTDFKNPIVWTILYKLFYELTNLEIVIVWNNSVKNITSWTNNVTRTQSIG